MPSASGTLALWTRTPSTKPSVSTSRWRLLPSTYLGRVKAALWASYCRGSERPGIDDPRAGLGVPAQRVGRKASRSAAFRCSQVPSMRQERNQW